MKSPGESGALSSAKARTTAAEGVAEHDDMLHPRSADRKFERGRHAVIGVVGEYGGTRLATLRTTKSSPGPGIEDHFPATPANRSSR